MRTPDARSIRSRAARIAAASATAVLAGPLAGAVAGAAAPTQATPPVTQPALEPAAAGYDIGIANVPVAFTVGDTQATFAVTVCNQGTVPTGAIQVQYAVPTGAGYVSPPGNNGGDGRLLDLAVGDLAVGASTTIQIVVGFAVGQTSPLVTAAEVTGAAGVDVDSTPTPDPIGFGAANEDDRLVGTDACTVETDASEDDRDVAVLDLQAGITTTSTTSTPSTTTPPPSSLVTVITTAPGPGVSPATLPVTGTPSGGSRNPLVLLAVALPVAWLGAVLSLRSRRLQGAGR
ncbi:MAG: hypothetical protein IT196_09835 [Acidimicrobiales bacterium]|nr:hypothetical protein [Acidimicrobiales bacterium]